MVPTPKGFWRHSTGSLPLVTSVWGALWVSQLCPQGLHSSHVVLGQGWDNPIRPLHWVLILPRDMGGLGRVQGCGRGLRDSSCCVRQVRGLAGAEQLRNPRWRSSPGLGVVTAGCAELGMGERHADTAPACPHPPRCLEQAGLSAGICICRNNTDFSSRPFVRVPGVR